MPAREGRGEVEKNKESSKWEITLKETVCAHWRSTYLPSLLVSEQHNPAPQDVHPQWLVIRQAAAQGSCIPEVAQVGLEQKRDEHNMAGDM